MASVDNSYTYLKNNSNESRNDITDSPEGRYDYSLVTPWKFMASTAFIIGKKGIVSFSCGTRQSGSHTGCPWSQSR